MIVETKLLQYDGSPGGVEQQHNIIIIVAERSIEEPGSEDYVCL